MNHKKIQSAILSWNNQDTPVSNLFNDIYYSNNGGLEETRYVFIKGNAVIERLFSHSTSIFTIAETGFGTGLNFLVLWQEYLQLIDTFPHQTFPKIRYISIEKHPLTKNDLINVQQHWETLQHLAKNLQSQWIQPVYGLHTLHFPPLSLELWLGDVNQCIIDIAPKNSIDAWFLDGFSPDKNPLMWTSYLFEQMYQLTHKTGTFATYTAAGAVRRGLQQVGFTVNKQKGYKNKREMLIGYK